MAIFTILLLTSLFVLAFRVEEITASSGNYYLGLLIFNAFGILVMTLFIGINTWNLFDQMRKQVAGSRLTARMVILFILLSLLPVSMVYIFSVRFINNSIDSWFDVRVEQAMVNSIELSRDAFSSQMRTHVNRSQRVINELQTFNESQFVVELEKLRQENDASEFTLFNKNNRVIASSSSKLLKVIPSRPDNNILLQVRQGEPYIGLDPLPEGLVIKVVAPFLSKVLDDNKLILLAHYPVDESMAEGAKLVEEGVQQYRQLVFLRTPLKVSYILTLSLMLLMSVLTSVLAAFYLARKMMEPVNALVMGTLDVASGNYQTRLPPSGNDELGFLVQSFNIMIFRLQNADNEIKKTQQIVEQQRLYLQTVLSSLSSGVMTFNDKCLLQVYNDKASELLDADLKAFEDRNIALIDGKSDTFRQFMEQVKQKITNDSEQWQDQIEIFTSKGRRVLLIKGTRLPEETAKNGVVLVFDDITELLSAQKNAAWSEVARRLAHEIKNPLTPIQLATERLRKKYLTEGNVIDPELINKSTLTIIKQVQSMQAMVKSFADYANMPKQVVSLVNVNKVIKEVVDLYQNMDEAIQWNLELDKHIKKIKIDPSRLRQVLGNLIKNAIEAQLHSNLTLVAIKTHWITTGKHSFLEILVEDRGEGIDAEIKERMFEPYNTSKPDGTGLGLAIVKNIVEESGGMIAVESVQPVGTLFRIKLPGGE